MIGKLQGQIEYIDENSVIVMTGGVGYNVFIPTSIGFKNKTGDPISLWIETHVREDHIHLYGFESLSDKNWFNTLQLVPGVGAKVALAILSTMNSDEIIVAIQSGDKTKFSKISGIGPKMAERITLELKSKIKNLTPEGIFNTSTPISSETNKTANNAISALENLGYKKTTISEIVMKIVKQDPTITLENLIKQSLKEI